MAKDSNTIVVIEILEGHFRRFKEGECDAIHFIHSIINTLVEHQVSRVIEF